MTRKRWLGGALFCVPIPMWILHYLIMNISWAASCFLFCGTFWLDIFWKKQRSKYYRGHFPCNFVHDYSNVLSDMNPWILGYIQSSQYPYIFSLSFWIFQPDILINHIASLHFWSFHYFNNIFPKFNITIWHLTYCRASSLLKNPISCLHLSWSCGQTPSWYVFG